ncbi:two-component system, OmpR family, response regulator [Acidocella aminolytica 101 = DSM 11237]|uniref:Regulatory protein VirG n=2 Tax=Acidocella TaxID=50709 RepID=A0A0D6PGL7_9PROT|nr:two component transcriptional regulator [Acidocella aminolytica 101 = DSM 11237]SHF39812.1 two-component system, OmpR family, response regulator [Acidocella aminolytica 101 = DSM 11237]
MLRDLPLKAMRGGGQVFIPPGGVCYGSGRIVTNCNLYCPKPQRRAIVTDMETLPHILVVDDDREIRELLAKFLERQRLRVTTARDGKEARRAFLNGHYQLVVLDLMLPGEGGLELARWFRAETNVPIIMLTAMADETDRIIGLELGADDYVTKPFNPRELLARIRAVLRRTSEAEDRVSEQATKVYQFAGWTLETARRRLLDPSGVEVAITGGEYDLLVALLDRPNRVLTRDMLLDLLRGRQAGPFDRAIDVAVSRLRRKLEDDGRNAQLIKTVRGGGYVLSTPVERS